MRLTSLEVSGFRAFAVSARFNLDADVVLISGPNGTGKTSLFDAVLWALTGRIPRFGQKYAPVVSLYSESGEAAVTLTLRHADGRIHRVLRTSDGEQSRLTYESEGVPTTGAAAEVELLRNLWPAATATADGPTAFATAFTRSVYLQQDLVREFIVTDEDDARFKVLSELVGIGRLTDFLREIERTRNLWSRQRTRLEREADAAEGPLRSLREQLARLRPEVGKSADLAAKWSQWWTAVAQLGFDSAQPEFGTADATSQLQAGLDQLQARRRQAERSLSTAKALLADMSKYSTEAKVDAPRLQELRTQLQSLEAHAAQLQKHLAESEAHAEAERRKEVELDETRKDLRAFAVMALRHLDDVHCPVCQQSYDREATRKRLEAVARPEKQIAKSVRSRKAPVSDLAAQVERTQNELSRTRKELAAAETRVREQDEWLRSMTARLQEIGSNQAPHNPEVAVQQAVTQYEQLAQMVGRLHSEGEQLSLAATAAVEQVRRKELLTQIGSAEAERNKVKASVDAHSRTYDVASTVIDAVRSASWQVVRGQVEKINPLVERIYARMDPHPSLTRVAIETITSGQRGRINVFVADRQGGVEHQDPAPVLSSSQMNALAVSVFLGFNLGVPSIPLSSALLDDPLQSLDDVNLLGLVDTLRRTSALRQVVLSTHDQRLAQLLVRKLRPRTDSETAVLIEFTDWQREGPSFTETPLPPAIMGIVLAA